jgi:hypothetical protein
VSATVKKVQILVPSLICLALVVGALVLRARVASHRTACVSNLYRIAQAKMLVAADEGKVDGDLVRAYEISKYLNWGQLRCPSSGANTYEMGTVGAPPVCSVHGSLADYVKRRTSDPVGGLRSP